MRALFGSNFLDDGEDVSAFLTDIMTQANAIGLKISNLVVDSVDTTAGTAQVHFTPVNPAGVMLAVGETNSTVLWQVKRNPSGVWQIVGSQRIAYVRVRTQTRQDICPAGSTNCSPTGIRTTGLDLHIENQGLKSIGSAVVTGPGLPAPQGVTLTAQPNSTFFTFPNPSLCQGCTSEFFTMTDLQIAIVTPNSTYTVQLFDLSGTPISGATYTEVVPVPPVLNSALPTLAFPSITNRQSLASITAVTLIPGWQIPSGLFGDTLSVFMFQAGPFGQNLQNLNVRADLFTNGTATSGTSTLDITAPQNPAGGSWTNGSYFINAFDQYGGSVSTSYQ